MALVSESMCVYMYVSIYVPNREAAVTCLRDGHGLCMYVYTERQSWYAMALLSVHMCVCMYVCRHREAVVTCLYDGLALCMCVCRYMYNIHTYIHAYIYIYIYIYIYVIFITVSGWPSSEMAYIYIYVCMCTHTHIYTCTHIPDIDHSVLVRFIRNSSMYKISILYIIWA